MRVVSMDGETFLFEDDLPKGIIECPTCKGRIVIMKQVFPMPDGAMLVNDNKLVCCLDDAVFAAQMGGFSECDMSVMCPPLTDEELDAMHEKMELFLALSYRGN